MSDDNKPLPTRDGKAIGHSIENRMLASVGGPDGIRTQVRIAADGTTTILKTRAGMPDFQTRKPPREVEEIVYLESGVHVNLTTSGEEEIPATWRGLDLVAESKRFHKWIVSSLGKIGRHVKGKMEDSPSRAMKKHAKMNMALKIPASLFSGKMRLFMQAQYGSIESKGFSVEDLGQLPKEVLLTDGAGPVARYEDHIVTINGSSGSEDSGNKNLYRLKYKPSENDPEINIGFTAGDSCGIFYSDGLYWLVTIQKSGTVFTTIVYPIRHDKKVEAIRQKIKGVRKHPEQDGYKKRLAQLEGYFFAYCSIDTSSPFVLNTFDIGSDRNPLAYGWKFNSDGTEAKIVVHGYSGTFAIGGSGTLAWTSMTVTMTLEFSPTPTPITEDNFTCQFSSEDHGRWVNASRTLIYTPGREGVNEESNYPFSLYLVYLSDQDWSGETPQSSTNTPIYGFYVDDVWTPVLYDHYAVTDLGMDWTFDCGENASQLEGAFDPRPLMIPDSPGHYSGSSPENVETWSSRTWVGWRGSDFSTGYEIFEEIYRAGDHYKISFGSQSVEGREGAGEAPNYADKRTVATYEKIAVQSVSFPSEALTFFQLADGIYQQMITEMQNSHAQMAAQYYNMTGNTMLWWPGETIATETMTVKCTMTFYEREHKGDRVAIVIPCGDAEALFVLKEDSKDEWEKISKYESGIFPQIETKVKYRSVFRDYGGEQPPGDWPSPGDVEEIEYPIHWSWHEVDASQLVFTGDPQQPDTKESKYITKEAVTDCPRNPEHDLFWRPSIQYYEPGMYSMTSVLEHFNCSEGLRSDSSMDGKTRFCGWI
jgi:hypothetical protein